jgi:hypothetical protein
MMWRRIDAAIVGLLWLAPSILPAEGAVKLLDCEITRICDAAGACTAGRDEVSFRMEPIELGAAGAGRYSLGYGGTQVEMQAMSDTGPFLWNRDSERHALLASSETGWLWHQLTLEPSPGSTIRFMSCSFQQ